MAKWTTRSHGEPGSYMAGEVIHKKGGTCMVFVVSKSGTRLMPTSEYRARKLLKGGRAQISGRNPFTIRLLYRTTGSTQPVEYKCDTGYAHIGVSICTQKRELVNEQYDLLTTETEHHNDRRKYRRARRSRLRYRKPRFNNRKGLISEDGFAPSIRNKRDVHINIFRRYDDVLPITHAVFEMGQFDTQVLKAIAEGKPVPRGADYQHGERYGLETLREAVFTRDSYTCLICGKTSFKDGKILHVHHVGFWKNDRTNRMANLMTVCHQCHNSKNHKPGGKLYGLEPKFKPLAGATFMTTVRFNMYKKLQLAAPDVEFHMTYGAMTKLKRKSFGVKKSHANDAYSMGNFHPGHRTDFRQFKKLRRNNRILEKFYDKKLIDTRTGEKVSGSQLGCNRTKRSAPRNNPQNLRMYRGETVSKGRRSIRKRRYSIQPGDVVLLDNRKYFVIGAQHYGEYIALKIHSAVKITRLKVKRHANGWQ